MLLSPRTIRYMAITRLPGNKDLQTFWRPVNPAPRKDGAGFGLGFGVVLDPAAGKVVCSEGEYNWGGLASTTFWIDPVEDLSAVFMTHMLPSSPYHIRPRLRQVVCQSLVD